MDVFMALIAIIGGLVVFDLLAFIWGKNVRQSNWVHGGYDPRHDWNSR